MKRHKKGVAVLGATGSIGRQTLEVIAAHRESYEVTALTAGRDVEGLARLVREFRPTFAVIADESAYGRLKSLLAGEPTKILAGSEGLTAVAATPETDVVVAAVVGFAGLASTLAALNAAKTVALANKESLVAGGGLVARALKTPGARLLPVDSEHSALFQCLVGESPERVEKLILTASGGPFRGKNRKELENVTPQQALKHPNWSMGAKITIDSATLMNKALEIIEAQRLFSVEPEKISVVVHPQSIVHSCVEFCDGSVKAQMGLPDMRLPIAYALAYPERISLPFPRYDFFSQANLTFEPPDRETFRSLDFAYEALKREGNVPCALNAANEAAVSLFLEGKISFLDIFEAVERAVTRTSFVAEPEYADLIETDREARTRVVEWAENKTAVGVG